MEPAREKRWNRSNYYLVFRQPAMELVAALIIVTLGILIHAIITSSDSDTQAPSIPSALTAKALTPARVALHWNTSTDNSNTTSYVIYRNGVLIGSSNSTGYVDTNLRPKTTYSYAVSSDDDAGNESVRSKPATVSTPADVTPPATAGNIRQIDSKPSSIAIAWSAAVDNTSIKNYDIYRNNVLVRTHTANSFRDNNLPPNTQFSYSIVARDRSGNVSPKSAVLTARVPAVTAAPTITDTPGKIPKPSEFKLLPRPINLHTTAVTDQTQNISWSMPVGSSGISGYKIYRNNRLVGITRNTNFKDMGLKPASVYKYIIRAYDVAGNVSKISVPLNTQTALDISPPTAPTQLKQTGLTDKSVSLAWLPASDDYRVSGYNIYRNNVLIARTKATNFTNTGLAPNHKYTYTIRAYDTSGNISPASTKVSSITLNK